MLFTLIEAKLFSLISSFMVSANALLMFMLEVDIVSLLSSFLGECPSAWYDYTVQSNN